MNFSTWTSLVWLEVVDRPQSQQVLSTRWVSKQRLDGSYKVRLVARGFEQMVSSDTDFYAGAPKLTTLRALLTIAAAHFINHRCQVTQNQSMWSQHRKHSWTLPKYGFARKLFKDSRFSLQAWGIHSTRRINDMSHNQLISDPSTCVKKRSQRSEDSTLLRHMDDAGHGTRRTSHERFLNT